MKAAHIQWLSTQVWRQHLPDPFHSYLLTISLFLVTRSGFLGDSMCHEQVTSEQRDQMRKKDIRLPSYKLGKVATKEHWVQDTEQATAKCLYDMNSLKDQTSTDTHSPNPAIYRLCVCSRFLITHSLSIHAYLLGVLCHVKRYCNINYNSKRLTAVTYGGNNSFLNCCDWCFICRYRLKQIQTVDKTLKQWLFYKGPACTHLF